MQKLTVQQQLQTIEDSLTQQGMYKYARTGLFKSKLFEVKNQQLQLKDAAANRSADDIFKTIKQESDKQWPSFFRWRLSVELTKFAEEPDAKLNINHLLNLATQMRDINTKDVETGKTLLEEVSRAANVQYLASKKIHRNTTQHQQSKLTPEDYNNKFKALKDFQESVQKMVNAEQSKPSAHSVVENNI